MVKIDYINVRLYRGRECLSKQVVIEFVTKILGLSIDHIQGYIVKNIPMEKWKEAKAYLNQAGINFVEDPACITSLDNIVEERKETKSTILCTKKIASEFYFEARKALN